jgi:hypothetical protein
LNPRTVLSSLAVVFLVAGCELAGVAAPPVSDVLAVESVLRVGADYQHLLLHRSMEGRRIRGEPGASVVIRSAGAPDVTFQPADLELCIPTVPYDRELDGLEVAPSCYVSTPTAGRFVRPGRTYDLYVGTADGLAIRGRTTVPELFRIVSPPLEPDPETLSITCRLPTHPFTLAWSISPGAWAYISTLRLTDWGDDLRDAGVEVPDTLDLTGVSVSAADTSQVFPGNLGLFQRFDLDQRVLLRLQTGLPPEANASLVLLAADRNYTNGVRGGRFNPSGNVRISSVTGDGVGVFGSVVAIRIESPGSAAGANVPACPAAMAAE